MNFVQLLHRDLDKLAGALSREPGKTFAHYTFDGWKGFGFGVLNQHVANAFKLYTRAKTVTSRWPSSIKEGAEFVIPTMS